MNKKVAVVGLKSCTKEEVSEEIRRFKSEGWFVTHKTHYPSGQPLPYNGVLYLEKFR